MKQKLFATALLYLISQQLKAQTQTAGCPDCPVNMINSGSSSFTSGDYVARDEVDAKPNTHLLPSVNQIHLYTDPTIQLNLGSLSSGYQSSVNYSDATVNSPIDFSLPVGTIQGQGSVTLTGQANYDIPITLPPGTNGMVPILGITYNSGVSDGIAGRGWNIRGISSISRVPKDFYHEGGLINNAYYKQGITLDDNIDVYALNGIRIIGDLSSSDGARLENDNFSKITFSNNVFTVETKEGLTMQYGYDVNERLMMGSPNIPFAWYLSKVFDKFGNIIFYTYYNSNNEISIKEINYSGTSIKFYYDIRDDKTTKYLLGNEINSSLILREIKVDCDNNYVRSYQFKYGFNVQSYLNEIIEYGSDNSKLNSTFIKYGDFIPLAPYPSTLSLADISCIAPACSVAYAESSPYTFTQHAIVHFHLIYVGGFNPSCGNTNGNVAITRNGVTVESRTNVDDDFDFTFEANETMGIYVTSEYKGKYFVKADITESDGNTVSTVIPTNLITNAEYQVGDFNGDGKSDLVAFEYENFFANNTKDFTGWRLYLNNDGSGINFTEINDLPALPAHNFLAYPLTYWFDSSTPQQVGFTVADFNKDGMDDIVIRDNSLNPPCYRVYYSTGSGFVAGPSVMMTDAENKFVIADVDGDGAPEGIEYGQGVAPPERWLKITWFGATPSPITIPYNQIKDEDGNTLYLHTDNGFDAADFDGDGIPEFVTVDISGIARVFKLTIDLNNANNDQLKQIYHETTSSGSYQNYFGDFNGDGISDNIKIPQPNASDPALYRFGTGKDYTSPSNIGGGQVASLQNFFLSDDINGDGKSDLIKIVSSGSASYFSSIVGDHLNFNTFCYGLANYGFPENRAYSAADNPVATKIPEFLLGDFDGDGYKDIFFKANGGQRVIAFINKGHTQQELATTISDGFRNKTEFTYATLANGGSNVYVKNANAPANVIDVQFPLNVVTRFSLPDGVGGINTTSYKYEGAKMHLQGKGFIGFDRVTSTSLISNIKVESNFDLNSNYYERFPTTTKTYLNSDLITKETFTSPFVQTSGLAHFIKTTHVLFEDLISGKTVNKDFTYDDVNGNITYNYIETALSGGTEKSEGTTSYEHAGTYGSILNVPSYVTTTSTLTPGGGGGYSRSIIYQHNPATGAVDQIISDPSTPNTITTSFTYYPSGTVNTKMVHVNGSNCQSCPDKNTSFEYDNKYRFVTKEDNPLNQITEASYDSKFGVPLTTKGIDGLITHYVYDGYGRKVKTVTPDNLIATTKYEWVQSAPSAPDPLSVSIYSLYSVSSVHQGSPSLKIYFDQLGREILGEGDGFGSINTYNEKEYDHIGNMVRETGSYQSGSTPPVTKYFYQNDNDHTPNELYKIEVSDGSNINSTNIDYTRGGGNTLITTTLPDGTAPSKTTDASGKLISATDNGGAITYDYMSNGQVKEIKVNGTTTNSMSYDNFGHQTSLYDKDAHTINYTYDAYGQLTSQTDANGAIYNNFQYDELGRIHQKTENNTGVYSYDYVHSGNNGVNNISEMIAPNGIKYSYTYDGFNRLTSFKEDNIPNQPTLVTSYTYDTYNNLLKTTFPGGFAIINEYDTKGYKIKIKNASTSNTIWQGDAMNTLGKYSYYTLGNGIQTHVDYNNFGMLKEIASGTIQDLKFDFNIASGNLNWREDVIRNLHEDFNYDTQNRLTQASVIGQTPQNISYNTTGTIHQKDDAGTYYYASAHPDVVDHVANLAGTISHSDQSIVYTPFNKIQSVTENNNSLILDYGPDQQRARAVLKDISTGNILSTKIYYPGYEKESSGSDTREVYYINSPTGLCAVYVVENGVGKMNYVYADNLGSVLMLTNENGIVATDQSGNRAEQSFDAWGRNRNPNDWTYSNIPSVPAWLYRGFSGHENLPQFALINMNGRCYDPIVGMMLSPDNYVQDITSTSGYNRYSYVLNNPLKYSDPSGNNAVNVHQVAGAFFWFGGEPYQWFTSDDNFGKVPVPGSHLKESEEWDAKHGVGKYQPIYNDVTENYEINGNKVSFNSIMGWEKERGNLINITIEQMEVPDPSLTAGPGIGIVKDINNLGIAGLRFNSFDTYYGPSEEGIPQRGLDINLTYTFTSNHNDPHYRQRITMDSQPPLPVPFDDCNYSNGSCPNYWNEDEQKKVLNGKSYTFYDRPVLQGYNNNAMNGSWGAELYLVNNGRRVFEISYGFFTINGTVYKYIYKD